MNIIDCIVVNQLLASDCEPISRIGTLLYHCNGTLNKTVIDEIAKLLVEVDNEIVQLQTEIESYDR